MYAKIKKKKKKKEAREFAKKKKTLILNGKSECSEKTLEKCANVTILL